MWGGELFYRKLWLYIFWGLVHGPRPTCTVAALFPPWFISCCTSCPLPSPLLFCFCSSPHFAFCVPHPLFSSIYRLYLLFFLVPLPTPNVFLLSSSPFRSKVVCLFPLHFLSFSSFVHVFVAHCRCCQSSNYPFALYAALCGGAMCSNGQVIRLWIVTWSLFFLSALSVLLLLLLLKSSRVCTYISVYPHRYWLFVEEDPPVNLWAISVFVRTTSAESGSSIT